MTDFASNPPPRRRAGHQRNLEFTAYFAVIFLLALPAACFGWLRDVMRGRPVSRFGPFALAWAEADRVTPLIFSA